MKFISSYDQIITANDAYTWAVYTNQPLPEFELLISQDVHYAAHYAVNILHKRWIEQESQIFLDFGAAQYYLGHFPEARTYSRDLPLVLCKNAIIDIPNTITDDQLLKLISLTHPQRYTLNKYCITNYIRWLSEPYIRQHLSSTTQYKVTDLNKALDSIQIFSLLYNTDFE